MPGLEASQLVEKYERATPQNAVGFVQFYGGGPNGAAANTVIITDGVTPETYTLADAAEAAAVTELALKIMTGAGGEGPSLLVDAWDISGTICGIRAKTGGVAGNSLNIALGAFGGARARAHNCLASGNCNLAGGRAEEVEVNVYGRHTITTEEFNALAVAAGTDEVPLAIMNLSEGAIIRSVLRRDNTGLYQSMVNVWIGLTTVVAGTYMLSIRDAGGVLGVGDVLDFTFSTE
ncbi:MAG: hypothetical protein ABIF77_01665 [bacterium]